MIPVAARLSSLAMYGTDKAGFVFCCSFLFFFLGAGGGGDDLVFVLFFFFLMFVFLGGWAGGTF